ncbi:class I SAM-dependent methyltransferase [Dactylosporangium sp. NPDC005572]|uniref:class I SAM-dependent methyltransferase n=1 Tax=Dactylosporangium sp. NPDC005572 TaxID=3156889 RepID=UPI0033B8205B
MAGRPDLGPVQETMLITLHARALTGDPDAARLVGELDYDFGAFAAHGRLTTVFHVLRSTVFDRWTAAFLAEHPQGTVVELGAGLSTRDRRLDNGTARWVFVDLPDAAALRARLLPDGERRHTVTGSVTGDAWAGVVDALPGPFLFLAEGVLVYLQPGEARQAVTVVGERFPGARLALDTYGTWVVRRRGGRSGPLGATAAALRWACDDPRELETWGAGLRLAETTRLTAVRGTGLPAATRAALRVLDAAVPRRMTNTSVSLYL